jgi:hypothetical protein
MVELYLHSPVCLHGVVLSLLSTGTTLPFLAIIEVWLAVASFLAGLETPGCRMLFEGGQPGSLHSDFCTLKPFKIVYTDRTRVLRIEEFFKALLISDVNIWYISLFFHFY